MISISNEYKNNLNNKALSPKSKIIVDGVVYLGNVIKTFPKIKHQATDVIGCFPAKTVSFEIYDYNNELDFINKEVEVYQGFIVNDVPVYVKQGIFIPKDENVKTNISNKVISFENVQDRTQLLDDKYESNLDWSDDQTHSGLEIVQEICTKKQITLKTSNFSFANYQFKQPNFPENITNRQVIARLGEIGGENAYFDYDGKLVIKGQTNTNNILQRSRYEKISVEKTVTYNTVILGKKDINDDIVYPSTIAVERVERRIEDNPFVDLIREEIIEEVARHIIGLTYTPYELQGCVDGHIYELNDVISVIDRNGNTTRAVVLDFENTSRIKSKIKLSLDSKGTTNYNLAGSNKESLDKIKLDVDHINKKIEAVVETTEEIQESIKTDGTQTNSAILLEDAAESDLVSITINPNGENGAGTLNNETNKYEITINVCGQNIFDNDMELGFISSDTGENIERSTACRTKGYINVSHARILSIQSASDSGYIKNLRFYDKDKNYLGYYTLAGSTRLFDLDRINIDGENEDIYYMRFIITDSDALEDVIGVMYNTTEYSEYVSNSKTYEFDNPIINEKIELELPKTYKGVSYITSDDEKQPDLTVEYVKDSILTDYVENRYLTSKSEISMTKNSILLQVSEIYATQETTKQLSTRINQTAKSIELTATDNNTSCGIVIKLKNEDGTEISSQSANITLSGLVKFTDLSTSGSTTINGANITTGTISADRIAANSITSGKLNISSLSSVSSNLGTITSGLISNSRAKLDLNDGILNIYNSSGGSMILSNAVRLSATAGVGITSNSNGNVSAPSVNLDLKACSGATAYLACMGTSSGTTEKSAVACTDGILKFSSTGYCTYNGTTVFGSSSRATKENIADLVKSQKEEVIELLKSIPLKQYDYKKEYGKPFNYGFIIEDIENTKLKDLLHITQAENNKDIKMYSTEDLTRLELIAIQELIERIQNIEKELEVNYG